MNRTLYAAGLLSFSVATTAIPAPVQAQEAVIDPVLIAHAITEINWLIQQYRTIFCAYQTAQATTMSVQHFSPNIMAIAPGLTAGQMRLPGSPAAALPMMNYGSNLSGPGQQFYSMNHYYTPQGNDFAAQELQRRQYATANLQGEAATGMQQAAARIASLAQLEGNIRSQPDVTAVGALNARIGAEKMYIANEGNNIQHLKLLMATQDHVDQQRAEQNSRMQSEQWGAAAAAQAGWGQ